MKKLILPTLLLMSTLAIAQNSLQIIDPISSAIVEPKTNPTAVHMGIKNISSDTVYARALRINISEVTGTSNYFCWDQCFPPNVDTGGAIMIQPDSTIDNFIGDYKHDNIEGTSVVQYCFFNRDDIADSVCITVSYINETVGSVQNNEVVESFDLNPNPVVNTFTIKYKFKNSFNNEFTLYDVVGNEVMKRELNGLSGKATFNTSELEGGIYFYTVKSANKIVKTERIVIAN